MKARILRHKPKLVFFVIYTAVFFLIARLALYLMPFLISFLFAVVMKPLYDYFCRRFNFRSTFAATVITLFVFGVVFAIIGLFLYLIALQAIRLFEEYGYLLDDFLSSPTLYEDIRNVMMSGKLMGTVTDIAAALFQIIPLIIIFVIITFALTVFFLHHMSDIKAFVLSRVGDSRRETASKIISTGYLLTRKFIRAYLILYLITFVEAAIIFFLTGVEYPLPFALLTAVADILPILGPGVIYVPFAIIFFLHGNYISGAALIIFFLMTAILREIMEPKIVSDNIKIHPLIVMTGVYLSIAAMDLWLLFYTLFLFLLYRVLSLSGVFENNPAESESAIAIF